MHELFGIYEKLYFKSLADKEKIVNSVNINFSFYISMLAVIFYMIRMIDYDQCIFLLAIFYVLLLFSIVLMFISIYFTYNALSDKYVYRYIPPYGKIEEYNKNLICYYKNINQYSAPLVGTSLNFGVIKEIKSILFTVIGQCCDENASLNKRRMFFVRKSLLYLWISGFLFIITTAIFAITDLDVSSPRKDTLIRDHTVASEIKNTGQNIIREINRYMFNIEKNTTPQNDASDGTVIQKKSEVTQKPIRPSPPTPPTFQTIVESYSFSFKND